MKTLSNIIDKLIIDRGWEDNMIAAKISDNWEKIFGVKAFKLVKIKSYKNKVLVLQIQEPTWKMEIMLRKSKLIKQINELIPDNPVQEIVIH